MATHISFPDIGQFRNAIRSIKDRTRYIGKDSNGDPVYDGNKDLPIVKYVGHVKLHGTNFAIGFDPVTKEVWYQSRERICTIDYDNSGVVLFFTRLLTEHTELIHELFASFNNGVDKILIYGEWCGKGIQKNVAISSLPKMVVIFNVRVGDNWVALDKWKDLKFPQYSIYNIQDYKKFELTIDFNHPELVQNDIVKLVEDVEHECPVGKAFGIEGIGEGIVWCPVEEQYAKGEFWFKTKGEKHSISKVKTLVPIDVEAVTCLNDFITNTVTEARCEQSITKLKEAHKPLDRTSMGEFIRWIYTDIVKEEVDTAVASNIELSKIGGPVANAAKKWFFANEDKFSS